MTRWLVLSLATVLAGACGGSSSPGSHAVLELLDRSPDRVVEQTGVLAPRPDSGWGPCSTDGWHATLEEVDGHPVAWSRISPARMLLSATLPRARMLELDLVAVPGLAGDPARATVSLNGTRLGEVGLTDDLERHTFETSASAWKRGDNVLELEVDAVSTREGFGRLAFGLARVAYDTPALVGGERSSPRLSHGTGLVYDLELASEALLEVRARAPGAGELELRLRALSPVSGSLTELGEPLRVQAEAGRLVARAPLAAPPEGILEVELTWFAATPDAQLELELLNLHEFAPRKRQPVVFVSVDTLAARSMSLHGFARDTTPRLSALARESVVFDSCRANAPWTVPSYMSQFTGLYPRAHELPKRPGQGKRMEWERRQLAPSRWTLAEFFRASGYRTAGFVDNPWLARGFGFEQGFDHWDTSATERDWSDAAGGIDHILPRALAWLDEKPTDRPFFLFVQAFDPHAPYNPASPWNQRFVGDGWLDAERSLPVNDKQHFAYDAVRASVVSALVDGPLPDELALEPIARAYHQKILQVDAGIGRLVDGLKERGLWSDTLFVFSADHGESTVEHDFYFGHSQLYDDVLHVPLVLKLPGGEKAGAQVSAPVQLVDLFPSLLGFAGSTRSNDHLHGRAWWNLLEGDAHRTRTSYAEGGLCEQYAVEQDGWKLIVSRPMTGGYDSIVTHPRLDQARLAQLDPALAAGPMTQAEVARRVDANPALRGFLRDQLRGPFHELYYLPDDPAEKDDLAARHPARVKQLLLLLERERSRASAAQADASFTSAGVVLDDEDLRRFRALGYVAD